MKSFPTTEVCATSATRKWGIISALQKVQKAKDTYKKQTVEKLLKAQTVDPQQASGDAKGSEGARTEEGETESTYFSQK